MNKKSGKDFDVAYIASQQTDHQRTANLLQWHISAGQNEALKKYSMGTLPVVMEHLEMAKEQYAMLTMGQASPVDGGKDRPLPERGEAESIQPVN